MSFNYKIEKVDLSDPSMELAIREVVKAAFGDKELAQPWYIYNNIDSKASRPSFILAAWENDAIIGCNAFIANDFQLNGVSYVGYQSCWTATHPEHQGKKVFVNIINEAKRILKDEGAGFLYGLPNDNSYPIFVKKLDFVEFDTMHARVLSLPFFGATNLDAGAEIMTTDALIIDEEQLYLHKERQRGSGLLRVDVGKNFIWGKIEKRSKYGIRFRVFIVGGISCTETNEIKKLFGALFKKYKVSFAELISCRLNTINNCIRDWKKAPSLNGFIYYNLNMPDNIRLNFMFGAIDVF